jgi:hypothetical protein
MNKLVRGPWSVASLVDSSPVNKLVHGGTQEHCQLGCHFVKDSLDLSFV